MVSQAAVAATYTSAPAFLGQLQGPSFTEDFSSLSSPATVTMTRSGNGFSDTFAAGLDLFGEQNVLLIFSQAGDNYLTTSGGFSSSITINFDGPNTNAVGGSFYVDSGFEGPVAGGALRLSFSDGMVIDIFDQSNTTFWGYVSSVPLTSVTLSTFASNQFVGISKVTVGTAVPEPGTGLLAALPAGLLLFMRRRWLNPR